MTINEITQIAREAAFQLPDETRQSLPIPVSSSDGGKIVFLFVPNRLIYGEGALLLAPSHKLEYNWAQKKTDGLRAFNSEDYGMEQDAGTILGMHQALPGLDLDDYEKKEERLYDLYGDLIPAYFKTAEKNPELSNKCSEFIALFDELSEQPLIVYYQTIGKNYFDWIRKNAKAASVETGQICTVEQIAKMAWGAAENRVSKKHRQSLPIPVLKNKEVVLVFLYCGAVSRPQSPSILNHPDWIQAVEYPSGREIDFRPTTPEELGLSEWKDPIGELSLPPGMTADRFDLQRKALLESMDKGLSVTSLIASTSHGISDTGSRDAGPQLTSRASAPASTCSRATFWIVALSFSLIALPTWVYIPLINSPIMNIFVP